MALEWIEWVGGECPVPYYTAVTVMFRNGEKHKSSKAGGLHWYHKGSPCDIVRYATNMEKK